MLNGNDICLLLLGENELSRIFSSGKNDEKILDFYLINYFYGKMSSKDKKTIDCYIIDRYGKR